MKKRVNINVKDKKVLMIYLDEEVHSEFKELTRGQNKSMQYVIEDFVERYNKRMRKKINEMGSDK